MLKLNRVVQEGNFFPVVSSYEKILLCFSSSCCGGCKVMQNRLAHLLEKDESILVCDVDAEVEYSLCETYDVRTLPTFVYIREIDGQKVSTKLVGAVPEYELKAFLFPVNEPQESW